MEVRYPRCAAIAVHQRTAVVAVGWVDERGRRQREVGTFGTTTGDLERLRDWLAARGATHVAMESTGVYWKPIFHVLAERFVVVLANAAHVKAVPGRKTDVRDAEWLLELMQHGLIRLSAAIAERLRPYAADMALLCPIAGIKQRAAEGLLAELGGDMGAWPDARRRCSWAALCPGNNQSGGKQRSGRTRQGNRWLKRVLVQAAWAAIRVKGATRGRSSGGSPSAAGSSAPSWRWRTAC